MDFAEVGIGNVSVDLGRADIRVPKQRLDRADVGAVDKKVGRERVAQGMRGNMFGDAGEFGVFFDDALDRAGGEPPVITGLVRGAGVFGVV